MSVPKPVLREALTKPAIALPLPHPAAAVESTALGRALRAWMLTAVLFMIPLVSYWPATFHEYGLRDDYSNLREAHEEPGTIVKFCASHARPVYGWLLQATYGQTDSVQDLQWMRCLASLLLGAISLVMFRGLRALGWSFNTSSVLCGSVVAGAVRPGHRRLGRGLALCRYGVVGHRRILHRRRRHGARAARRSRRAGAQWTVALGLMVVGALIYQPSALFYVVPLAGALIAQRRRDAGQTARWLGLHTGFTVAALGLAYCTMKVLYATGMFVKSGRIAFEHNWLEKMGWFVHETLPNALSLFVLNDNNHHDRWLYLDVRRARGRHIARRRCSWNGADTAVDARLIWAAGLVGLPILALSVSLVASERYATYRTIFAMTAVLLCFPDRIRARADGALGNRRPPSARHRGDCRRFFHGAASRLCLDRGPAGK